MFEFTRINLQRFVINVPNKCYSYKFYRCSINDRYFLYSISIQILNLLLSKRNEKSFLLTCNHLRKVKYKIFLDIYVAERIAQKKDSSNILQKEKKREGEKREKNKNALQSNRTLSLSLFHHKFHLKFRLKSTSYIKFTLKFSVYIKLSSVITVEPPRQQFPRRFSRNFKTRTRRNVSLVKFFTRLRRFSPRTGHLLRR